MTIAKASPADIPEIMDLIRRAVKAMNDGGLYQWDETYPNKEVITEDITAGSLFKISEKGKVAGIIVLNGQYSPEYDALKWEVNDGHPLFVHRLCILPDYQGKGLAKRLMRFAQEYAKKNNYAAIRLDTFTGNEKALGLYDGLGYRRVGQVTFDRGKFQCFEIGVRGKRLGRRA